MPPVVSLLLNMPLHIWDVGKTGDWRWHALQQFIYSLNKMVHMNNKSNLQQTHPHPQMSKPHNIFHLYKRKEILNRKLQSIYRSGSVEEILKPWRSIVVRHPFNIVPVWKETKTRQSQYGCVLMIQIGTTFLHFVQCYLWFEMYMMGTPGIFLTLLFRSLSTVARM